MVSERKRTPWYLRLMGYKKYRYWMVTHYSGAMWVYSDV